MKLLRKLIIPFIFFSSPIFAECVKLPSRDGQLGGVFCFEGVPREAPNTNIRGTQSGVGPGHGAGSRGSSPSYNPGPSYTPSPVNPTRPGTFQMPSPWQSPSPVRETPPPNTPEIKLPNREFEPPSAAQMQAANAAAYFAFLQLKELVTEITLESIKSKAIEYQKWDEHQIEMLPGPHDEIEFEEQLAEQSKLTAERTTNDDGVVLSEFIPHPDLRKIREKIELKSSSVSAEGRNVRKVLNRLFVLVPGSAASHRVEGAQLSIGLAIAADQALADGQTTSAKQLISASLTTLDIALGFVPIVSSINDATQIMFGMMTGYDYNGHLMGSGDYALRGAGIVIGLLPASQGIIRFGSFAISKATLFIARAFRTLRTEGHIAGVRFAGPLLNSIGGVGTGISKYVFYQTQFGTDTLRFKHMMAGFQTFKETSLLKMTRELTKHPQVAGFETDAAMRAVYNTEHSRAVLAEERLYDIIKNGIREDGWAKLRNEATYDYRLPSGIGARFGRESGEMIGFL